MKTQALFMLIKLPVAMSAFHPIPDNYARERSGAYSQNASGLPSLRRRTYIWK